MSPDRDGDDHHTFRDRSHAGRLLAERLRELAARDDVVMLGLPRGGSPLRLRSRGGLNAPRDVFVVQAGVRGHEEAAFGATATGGLRVLNQELIERLDLPEEWIEAIDARQRRGARAPRARPPRRRAAA